MAKPSLDLTAPLDVTQPQAVSYCYPIFLRDEQIRLATKRVTERIQPYHEDPTQTRPATERIAVVGYGPSLAATWEALHDYRYIITCSGAHRFLIDRGIVPTHHLDVDPRAHKADLLGAPHPDVEYLIASTCHPRVFDRLEGYQVKLWHIFAEDGESFRVLPRGEWSLTGGCDAGMRCMTMARFLGFVNLHVFGLDGCEGETGKHAAAHPSQPKGSLPVVYNGITYQSTPALVECARQTFKELNQMPDVTATFHGEGLIQAMARDYVRQPVKGQAILGFIRPETISAELRDLNAQLHVNNPAYGVGGDTHAPIVLKLLADNPQLRSVLDYGCGKGQTIDTSVLTPRGFRRLGDIRVGDQVIGANGRSTGVIAVHPRGRLPLYRVTFNDGTSTLVDGEHLWAVRTTNHQKRGQAFVVRSTQELAAEDLRWNSVSHRPLKWRIPMVKPVEFAPCGELPLDPYLLGVLLGDGCLCVSNVEFTTATSRVADNVAAVLPAGLELVRTCKRNNLASNYRIVRQNRRLVWGTWKRRANPVKDAIRALGLDGSRSWNKFVPDIYLFSSPAERLALLQGLIDTDGELRAKHLSYSTASPQLASDVVFLAQSLGCCARITTKVAPRYQGGKIGRPNYGVHIKPPEGMIPARAKPWEPRQQYHAIRAIKSIQQEGEGDVACLTVDAPDGLYVTEHFIVTHNSRLAAALPWPIWEFDPGIPGKDEAPRPADLVVCTDVLEHVEPDKLAFVLDDLRRVVQQIGYFVISCGPAQKQYADGRNTHLIQEGALWWRHRLELFFLVAQIIEKGTKLHVVVAPKSAKAEAA